MAEKAFVPADADKSACKIDRHRGRIIIARDVSRREGRTRHRGQRLIGVKRDGRGSRAGARREGREAERSEAQWAHAGIDAER